jgi:hypothetical protein
MSETQITKGQTREQTGKPMSEWSDDELRIKCAELCGWVRHGDEGIYGCWDDPAGFTRSNCPDYPNDLNAMNEAEKLLTFVEQGFYFEHLQNISFRDSGVTSKLTANVWGTSARQRCIAFILCLQKESQ